VRVQEVESVADELERLLVLRSDHAAPGRGAHLDGVRVRDRDRVRLRLRVGFELATSKVIPCLPTEGISG